MSNKSKTQTLPSTDFLDGSNRFMLSIAVAKRARQLKDGAKPLVPVLDEPMNPVTVAMAEMAAKKLTLTLQEIKHEDEDLLLEDISTYLDATQPSEEDEEEVKPKKEPKQPKVKSKSLAA